MKMKHLYTLPLFILFLLVSFDPCFADRVASEDTHTRAAILNNEGTRALNERNCPLAIEKFTRALEIEPNYELAHENLAMAHNDYGILLADNPAEALKQLHEAVYLRMSTRQTKATLENIDAMLRVMGKDPKRFADRVNLGDEEKAKADLHGAIVEYFFALQVKDDPQVHKKMGDVYEQLGEHDKAKTEYELAKSTSRGGAAK
jgi:Tfp pilus assembly protein PilF